MNSYFMYACLFVYLSHKCLFIYGNNILVSTDGSWCSCGWSWIDSNHSRKLFPILFSVLYIWQKKRRMGGGGLMHASIDYGLSSYLSIINKMDRAALLFQYHYKTFGVMVLDWNGIDWWWDAVKGMFTLNELLFPLELSASPPSAVRWSELFIHQGFKENDIALLCTSHLQTG